MSILKVNTIQNASGSFETETREASEGRARAHCSVSLEYDQANGPLAFRGSYNILSAVDFGTGRVRFWFKHAMSDTNYTFMGHCWQDLTSYSDGLQNQDEVGFPMAKFPNNCFLGAGDIDEGANSQDPDGYCMTIWDNSTT